MKSAVETLNPTRVRLTVEVPFDELKPSVDSAYKKIAQQITLPGFRKGRVPARLIDQRFGRGIVLEQAVNDALPQFYSQAIQDNSVDVLGQPDVDVTEFADGEELKFTAEVDVRPEITLPEYTGLDVTVSDADVDDEAVEEQLDRLRERFATLLAVDRPVEDGDFVQLDLVVSVNGEELEDGRTSGLSYQVGSGNLVDGLDEALIGRSDGDSSTFTTTLEGGEHAGEQAEVSATVRSVKRRELPEADDDFAQTASEFDTVEELRADTRSRMERLRRIEQGVEARDKTLEALLSRVDVPVPERILQGEIEARAEQFARELEAAGLSRDDFLRAQDVTAEEFDENVAKQARDSIVAQFVLDAIAAQEQLSVTEAELSDQILRRAARLGRSPEQYAQEVVQAGQVPALVSEVVRGKALARVMETANIVDESGRTVDLEAQQRDEGTAGATVIADDATSDDVDARSLDPDAQLHEDEATDTSVPAAPAVDAEVVRGEPTDGAAAESRSSS